jgi:prepilin-type N-terminal cleavage/methylation domain-containing protein
MSARRGFTLIELMVVISIIAIMATVGFVSFTNAQKTGRDSKRKSDLRAIQQGLEAYYQANNNQYPGSTQCPSGCASDKNSGNWPASFISALVTPGYINQLPIDPLNTQGSWTGGAGPYYVYDYEFGGVAAPQSYKLCTHLENSKDKDINVVNGNNVTTGLPCSGPTGSPFTNYNFEVDSP